MVSSNYYEASEIDLSTGLENIVSRYNNVRIIIIDYSYPVSKKKPRSIKNLNDREKALQEIISNAFKNRINPKNNLLDFLESLDRTYPPKNKINPYSGRSSNESPDAKVSYVSPSELPSGDGRRALGVYNTMDHSIRIANNLPPHVERFVYHHEIAHSMGIHDEAEADRYAASIVGYYI